MAARASKALKLWRGLSLLWLVNLTLAYSFPSDTLYAITIWPPFVWAGFAFVLSLAGIRKHRTRGQLLILFAWLAFWIVMGEERKWLPARASEFYSSEAFRVVTLNCAGGSIEAAQEAFRREPWVLLLQESPSRKELERIKPAGWSLLSGPDTSILVEGTLQPIPLPKGTHNFVAGIAQLPGQEPLLLVSLRLQPPIFRLDYWSPGCWRAYAENRRSRRAELQEIARFLQPYTKQTKWVMVGGDYNTPPDTGIFAPYQGWLHEDTDSSGYTATNEFPMARIDQVWSSTGAIHARAFRTQNSDHRLVEVWYYPNPKQGSVQTSGDSAAP